MTARTDTAELGTKQRLVRAAGELFRRNGYSATGIKAVLDGSDSSYASLYHFFPGGKDALGAEALRLSGEAYRDLVLAYFPPAVDVALATSSFFNDAADMVESTDFVDACPIASVALEVANRSDAMRTVAMQAFDSWIDIVAQRSDESSAIRTDPHELAENIFCLLQGAFLLARVTRSANPIRAAGRAARQLVEADCPPN